MRVKLKLFASLRSYVTDSQMGELVTEVDAGATPATLIGRFALPREQIHLVLVNGVFVAPDDLDGHALREGDEVAMWPPVAGG